MRRTIPTIAPSATRFTVPIIFAAACSFQSLFVSCSDSSCEESATCVSGSSSSGNLDGGDRVNPGGEDVFVPPGCDYSADPKDSPACVVDDGGIFVDKAGNDSDLGTKAKPKQSIGAAIAALGNGKARVFVCGEGPFEEKIKITANTSIYGGFECGTWKHVGTQTKVVPNEKGYAIEIAEVSAKVFLADLNVIAKDATDAGESSVAIFAAKSGDVTLRRMRIQAGLAKDGAPPTAPASNHFGASSDGNGAPGSAQKTCMCPTYGRSSGGGGGTAGNPAAGGGGGSAMPAATIMGPRTSLGGDGFPLNAGTCGPGKNGSDGSPRNGGSGADSFGDLTPAGFVPKAGAPGEAGNPGAGGGGGGGGDTTNGGGGACGGCGGAGGVPGNGGGSSIAVLAFETLVITERGDLVTGAAGIGGKGGPGQAGAPGGGPGVAGGGDSCGGGRGGNGAGGGAGGGGAGGLSAGIVFKGPAPMIDPATGSNLGASGMGGPPGDVGPGGTNGLGTAPSGGAGTKGKDGVKTLQQEL